MIPQIAILSPFSSMESTVNEIIRQKHLNIIVRHVFSDTIEDIARTLIEQGVRIFISRGNLVSLLRDKFDVPVIEVKYSFFDAYSAYQKALKLCDKVAFAPLADNYLKLLLASQEHMPCARIFSVRSDDRGCYDYGEIVESIRQAGCKALIGGSSFEIPARQAGLHYISNEVSPDAVEDALEEAFHLQRVEKERLEHEQSLQHKYETINAILNCVSEHIVNTDVNGAIVHMNRSASLLLKTDSIGTHISELLASEALNRAIENGYSLTNEIVSYGKASLLCSCEPIRMNGRYSGMVISLQPFNRVQSAERKIRDSILSKGHMSQKKFEDILGESRAVRAAKELAARYAQVDDTVLILGETGTGKELFAQSIHSASSRRLEPFVAINCAALASDVLESELFGYVRGAFTGAKSEGKTGLFELAHRGTLFLDEISEMPLSLQLKLLRVIQERKIMRIGDDKLIPIDVRLITASNKNLLPLIQEGRLREDFYYRICVLELCIPPLRERREDIAQLIQGFLLHGSSDVQFTDDAISLLSTYDWPGNVRQLGNMIARLSVISRTGIVDEALVRETMKPVSLSTASRQPEAAEETLSPHCSEADIILRALKKAHGNRQAAAKLLNMSTATLYRKLRKIREKDSHALDLIRYDDTRFLS